MNNKPIQITRRRALELSGVAALAAFAAACSRATDTATNPTTSPAQGIPTGAPSANSPTSLPGVGTGTSGEIPTPSSSDAVMTTPNKDFYITSAFQLRPQVPDNWKLTITGLVDNPLSLTLDDIKQFNPFEEMRTFECISNPVGGTLIGNAIWKAVRLADVLEKAGIQPTTKEVKIEAFDSYVTSVPLETVLDQKSLLAFEMNGEPLPIEHGYPLRVIFPGRYGMKQPKWLKTMTAIDDHFLGFWEAQGWSNDAFVLPNSQITVPEDGDAVQAKGLQIRGVGFADGNDGVAKIDVSFDNGKTWQETTLVRGPNPYVWTNWAWQGDVPVGADVLLARVTTNSGKTQEQQSVSLLGGTFPNGTSAIHQIVVNAKA
ncbi:MAG TPA: molybdopterin-dependent oxidoreductase [Anaerolineae bacterium]|nr:molybdopterin-dependent oxidoreductase [Anaerolineae bacterium]